jgi:hypothetical protein
MSATVPPTGCLTDAEIAELEGAVPGRAPETLALHLASCERCQARALFGRERLAAAPAKAAREPLTLGRLLVLVGFVLGAMAVFLWTLLKLAGRIA